MTTRKKFEGLGKVVWNAIVDLVEPHATVFVVVLLSCLLVVMSSGFLFVSFRMCRVEDKICKWEQKMGLAEGEWIKAKASTFGRGDNLMGKAMYTGIKVNAKDLFFASRDLPMGTRVWFYNPTTKKHAVATCLDWGPAEWTGRVVDLGPALCDSLAFRGVGYVQMKIID